MRRVLVHQARVRRREVSCLPREVVQHGVNGDAAQLDLDGEWAERPSALGCRIWERTA